MNQELKLQLPDFSTYLILNKYFFCLVGKQSPPVSERIFCFNFFGVSQIDYLLEYIHLFTNL